MMLLAGAAYGLHFLYKKIIRPWLFGPQQKKTSLEETVSQMNANLIEMIGDLTHAVQNLNETVGVMKQKQEAKSEIQELKSEVASLKALLLGRWGIYFLLVLSKSQETYFHIAADLLH